MSSNKSPLVETEKQLSKIEKELYNINQEIKRLTERRNQLILQKDKLKDDILLKKSNTHCSSDWDKNDFAWSSQVYTVLKEKFKLDGFRPNQLAAINVTLLKKDAIVIMPTGSGKSLCYQLPALIDAGTTVVISPMISLMEDQIGQLRKLGIEAEMLQASNTREENNRVMKLMLGNSTLKLLYVSPEKLAKSKSFMTKLQKMYKAGALARIAIDEVHCCSTWGHDFRPDYQYLSILKTMFPEVPILGLTATATTKVMLDVQKMLQIEGCVVLKAPFNRPNLFYEVRVKPQSKKDCLDELADLLSHRFRNESGIIYTTSIRECEDLRDELRSRGLRVSAYHAKLEPDLRSKVHTKWLSGEYQAVVATIAFGLGIDKPNVRFVIHHCLSKSMENFYQESGRAGRDGLKAHCILYYRLGDVFKLSPMVFETQTGLPNLYNIVAYCLDPSLCRRSIIASYFDEPWSDVDCNRMCDHCDHAGLEAKKVDISKHARTLCSILEHVSGEDVSVTSAMLLDLWYKQKVAKVKSLASIAPFKAPTFNRDTAEKIIAFLLINNYLKQDFHFTPYSTISYLKAGPKARLLSDSNHSVIMNIAGKRDKDATSNKKEFDSSSNDKTKDSTTKISDKRESINSIDSKTNDSTTKIGDKRKSINNIDSTTNDSTLVDRNGVENSKNLKDGWEDTKRSSDRCEDSKKSLKKDNCRGHCDKEVVNRSTMKRSLDDCIEVISDGENRNDTRTKTESKKSRMSKVIDLSSDDECS